MYVCGPTVYDLPHLGHGRFTLVWDTLRRWLTFLGLDVTFVSNITDIDDNIIARAQREGRSEADVAGEFEDRWWDAMERIGVARPTHTPHATDYVEGMVGLIEQFLADGIAYSTGDGVYLDISKVPDYGALAGQSLDSLRAGARIEAHEEKRSPLDFALWKSAKPGEPTWPAPFGDGRPGWHTECVVMSLALLGEGFDLHCGGFDLRFPHHENERAQAVAAGRVFARHWAHNGWVMVGDQKMSKSLGNFTSLTDLTEKSDPRSYRLLVLRSHYRSPIEVSPATIADAERGLERLDGLARRFDVAMRAGSEFAVASDCQLHGEGAALFDNVRDVMANDFDTPAALALIFEAVTAAHAAADRGEAEVAQQLATAVTAVLVGMGLELSAATGDVDDESAALVAQRDAARARKDWSEADRLRDALVALGWTVEDSATGTQIRK
jgi:cysteinyl-tRNA synthetase